MSPFRAAVRLTAIYIIVGLIWVLFSDQVLDWAALDALAKLRLQTVKGWAFVVITGLLFGFLAWHSLCKQQKLHERDALTGLLNWYMFRDVVENHLHAAQRDQEQLALAVVNIDGFRQLNSQLGQRNGDLLLQHLAEKLRTESPTHATVCRVAADEFCIALRGKTAFDELEVVVRRVQTDLEFGASKILQTTRGQVTLTCSVGIAAYPQDAVQAKELITAANLALAEAKDLGLGQCCSYRQSYSDSVRHRAQLVRDLDQAISAALANPGEREALYVVYQPQFTTGPSPSISVEALLRWNHPLHGHIPPDEFVQLAEQYGLIKRLTDYVCQQVVRESVESDLFETVEYISINVSGHDINSGRAREEFAQRFERTPDALALLKAGRIQLEITETAFMQNKHHARDLLSRLRNVGYRIAIDDFGTGYSSLSLISQLPVNELKIDRSFIGKIEPDNDSSADALIVRTIIAMAHALNLQVVAEGVETQYHVTLLTELACDRLQGYFYGRPVPIEQFKALYGTGHTSPQPSH